MNGPVSNERALWLARHIVPNERWLRAQIARWRLPHDLEPDDIIQEAYAKLAAMDSVLEIRNPRTYLFSIARSTMLMHIRHSRVVSIQAVDNLEKINLAADEPSPEMQVSDREQLHLLAIAISELPEPSRSAFILRVIDELPYREIGKRLGRSDNAVQKNIAKSLRMLMERLGRGRKTSADASNLHRPERVRAIDVKSKDQ